ARQRDEASVIEWAPVDGAGAPAKKGSLTDRLGVVVLKALARNSNDRLKTAAELTTELRRAAGTELATTSRIAQLVSEIAGARIRERRGELAVPPPTPGQAAAAAEAMKGAASSPAIPAAAPTPQTKPAPPPVPKPRAAAPPTPTPAAPAPSPAPAAAAPMVP